MACGGIGNIRVVTKYRSEDTFEQDIFIESVENPFSILYDPEAKRYDRQDGDYMFVFADITRDAFKKRYPNKRAIDFIFLGSVGIVLDATIDYSLLVIRRLRTRLFINMAALTITFFSCYMLVHGQGF